MIFKTIAAPTIALSLCLSAVSVQADEALAKAKNCLTCHTVDKKIVGPSYKEISAKYKGDKTAAAKLSAKIISGGGDVWGAVKMPANPQVSKAEADKLAAWALSQ